MASTPDALRPIPLSSSLLAVQEEEGGGPRAEVEAQIHPVVAEEHRILEGEEERRHLQEEEEGEMQMMILLKRPCLYCV